jgi:hypothetical protein
MLQEYTPSLLEEMDHYNIDRQCWQCAYYREGGTGSGTCTSLGMARACRDMTGVDFGEDIKLPVTEKTDAALCGEFELSRSAMVMEEIADMIGDARIEAQRHANHYAHLRRTAHAY